MLKNIYSTYHNFFLKFLSKVFVSNREISQAIKLKASSCMLNIIKHNKITLRAHVPEVNRTFKIVIKNKNAEA